MSSLTNHTATVAGTQARGSAVGTLKQWSPPSYTAISAGVLSEVAVLEIPDSLGIGIDLDIEGTSTDGVEYLEVSRSSDLINWQVFWTKTVDPDTSPYSPGDVKRFVDIHGWRDRYLRVRVRSKTAGGGSSVKVLVTDSIFVGNALQAIDPDDSSVQGFADRNKHVYAEGEMFAAALTASFVQGTDLTIDVSNLKLFDLVLAVELTNWTSLAEIQIRVETQIDGAFRTLTSANTSTDGEITYTEGLIFKIPVGSNIDTVISLPGVAGNVVRLYAKGDAADGELAVYAVAKVP